MATEKSFSVFYYCINVLDSHKLQYFTAAVNDDSIENTDMKVSHRQQNCATLNYQQPIGDFFLN